MSYVSVMDKARSRLEQKTGGVSLAKKVDQMHKMLSNMGNKNSSRQAAADAEAFLSWLVFKNENSELDDIYKDTIAQNAKIKKITSIFAQLAKQSVDMNKKQSAMAKEKVTEKAFQHVTSKIGSFTLERGGATETLVKRLGNILSDSKAFNVIGDTQGTVVIDDWSKNILEEISDLGQYELERKLVQQDGRFAFYRKRIKTDISSTDTTGTITYEFNAKDNYARYINACLEVLTDASVKSVNNIKRIHLEYVDVIKAYAAFLRYAGKENMGQAEEAASLFKQYYQDNSPKPDEYITRHFNHLFSVYAYAGFGASFAEDLSDISDGVKYLIVVDNLQKHVYVKSSAEVIDFLLSRSNKKMQTNVVLNLQSLLNRQHKLSNAMKS